MGRMWWEVPAMMSCVCVCHATKARHDVVRLCQVDDGDSGSSGPGNPASPSCRRLVPLRAVFEHPVELRSGLGSASYCSRPFQDEEGGCMCAHRGHRNRSQGPNIMCGVLFWDDRKFGNGQRHAWRSCREHVLNPPQAASFVHLNQVLKTGLPFSLYARILSSAAGKESSIWTSNPICIGFTGPSALSRADGTTHGEIDVQTNGEQVSVTRPPCPLGVQYEGVDGWSGKVTTRQSKMRVKSDFRRAGESGTAEGSGTGRVSLFAGTPGTPGTTSGETCQTLACRAAMEHTSYICCGPLSGRK